MIEEAQPRPPEARPLDTPDQLLAWSPSAVQLCRAAVPLPPPPQQQTAPDRQSGEWPRLLACHDMAGGYAEDRLVQGGGDADFYLLRHWHCLDAFVYFSHRLVTIPPPGWVNAAHTHGVPVLGTLITEWDAGAAHCRRLFGSAATAEEAACQLAAIAQHHGFEGWVINIENAMEPEHIPHLLHFLRVLTAQMREVAPGWSQVIWYDAVTTEGNLRWQDTLNHLNRPFFDACDAIWINYTWKEGTPAAVRQEAGGRCADVYMGIDCFGRGTFGGGGFNCDVALHACLEHGLSAALFATGWPYEGDCGPDASPCWRQRDARFWQRIEDAWSSPASASSGATEPAAAKLSGGSRDGGSASGGSFGGTVRQLPLYSDFSLGCGRARYQEGRQLAPCAWYNLSCQSLQPLLRVRVSGRGQDGTAGASRGAVGSQEGPNSTHKASGGDAGRTSPGSGGSGSGSVTAEVSEHLAFSGGCSVHVGGSLDPNQLAAVQLFSAAVELPAAADVWVRLTTAEAGGEGAQARLALRLALPHSSDADARREAGSAHGSGSSGGNGDGVGSDGTAAGSGCGSSSWTIELVPQLSSAGVEPLLPISGTAAGSGPTSARAATACTRCSTHPATAASHVDGDGRAAGAAGAVAEWVTWQYRLTPADLAAAGGLPAGTRAVMLTGVDLLLSSHSSGSTSTSFQLYLGEVCIEAAQPGIPPTPPPSVQQLSCSGLHLTTESDPDGQPTTTLAAQLSWQPPAGGARCCHVWCVFCSSLRSGGDGGEQAEAERPRWLGTACADGFWATDVLVPQGTSAVRFIVQPVGCNGLAQPLGEAATVTAPFTVGAP